MNKRLIVEIVLGLGVIAGVWYGTSSVIEHRADKALALRQERIASLERTQAALEERNAQLDRVNQQHTKRIAELEHKLAALPPVPAPANPVYISESIPLAERLRSVGLKTCEALGNESRPLGFGIGDGNTVLKWGMDQPRLEAMSLRLPVLEKFHDEAKVALEDAGKQIDTGKLQHSNDLAIISEERGKFRDLEKKVAAKEAKSKLKTGLKIGVALLTGYYAGKHL